MRRTKRYPAQKWFLSIKDIATHHENTYEQEEQR